MNEITNYVARVAEHFRSQLGPSLIEVYKLGSLAHGGFSAIYSDIDVGLLLNCKEPPSEIARLVAEAKNLHPDLGKTLSVLGQSRIQLGPLAGDRSVGSAGSRRALVGKLQGRFSPPNSR